MRLYRNERLFPLDQPINHYFLLLCQSVHFPLQPYALHMNIRVDEFIAITADCRCICPTHTLDSLLFGFKVVGNIGGHIVVLLNFQRWWNVVCHDLVTQSLQGGIDLGGSRCSTTIDTSRWISTSTGSGNIGRLLVLGGKCLEWANANCIQTLGENDSVEFFTLFKGENSGNECWTLTVLAIVITIFFLLFLTLKNRTLGKIRLICWMCMRIQRSNCDCDRWAQLQVWRLNDVLRELGHSFIPILICICIFT